ncbi:MAG: CoB--CoM heterodisulfide reductase iron-sulfur subunit B family protein [Chloroflexi bacterium]|nr:CoB--CoM heterodisulfide reductase iron-sulfur subunit B family protein [Chloroflexota bacterium]
MKSYSYYPGCSSEATGIAYDISTEAVCKALDIELLELEDWNCCGTTPYFSINELEALSLAARNLALAEKKGLDLVTACNACFKKMKKTDIILKEEPHIKVKVDEALAAGNQKYNNSIKVRHLLEVIVNDIGFDNLKAKIKKNLEGLKIAAYYGCQISRPKFGYDDPEYPMSLDNLLVSLGAEAVPFPMKARCCGASLVAPEEELVLSLINKILKNAQDNGAQCIATTCPLCQLNLDAYQSKVNKKFKTNYNLPVFFFTQLIGVALGIESKELAFDKGIVPGNKVLQSYLK